MNISVVVLDDVFDLGLSAVLDAFTTANELVALRQLPVQPFQVTMTGVRDVVRTSQGFTVSTLRTATRPDWVIVPAIGFKMPGALVSALARPDVRETGARLIEFAREGSQIAAACIGTFVLAESGLLAGQRATTTWWLTPLFRERYPGVRLEESRMIVSSGSFVTAGAALSHMDLALWIIRRHSPELAALVARYLIVDSRPSQSAYALTDHLAHADPTVLRFEQWARDHLARPFALDAAARASNSSTRTLARRTRAVLGVSPLGYVQRLRLERAVHLLRTSDAALDDIAEQVGYQDAATLRHLLRRRLGVGVREIRGRGGKA